MEAMREDKLVWSKISDSGYECTMIKLDIDGATERAALALQRSDMEYCFYLEYQAVPAPSGGAFYWYSSKEQFVEVFRNDFLTLISGEYVEQEYYERYQECLLLIIDGINKNELRTVFDVVEDICSMFRYGWKCLYVGTLNNLCSGMSEFEVSNRIRFKSDVSNISPEELTDFKEFLTEYFEGIINLDLMQYKRDVAFTGIYKYLGEALERYDYDNIKAAVNKNDLVDHISKTLDLDRGVVVSIIGKSQEMGFIACNASDDTVVLTDSGMGLSSLWN